MADQRRHVYAWECFTCGGCGRTVRRRRAPHATRQRCRCCCFLDTVRDVRMREALRRVFEPGGGPVAEPRPNWRFGDRADATGDAGQPRP